MASIKGNQKVSKKRNVKWQKSLTVGRLDALINPSFLRLYRAKNQVPQEKVASEINVAVSTYGSIERGKRLVKPIVAEKLANFFKTNVNKLFKKSTKNKYVAIIK